MTKQAIDLIVILGATAGGKTSLAVQAARDLQGEIISADSRQVYRGMDLGTGKDLTEYGEIPYHLIDIAEPGTEYSLFQYQRDCFAALEEIRSRGKQPILCGGTGLYLESVLNGYRMIEIPENPQLREELSSCSDTQLRTLLLELKPLQHNRTDLEDRSRLLRAIEISIGERNQVDPLPPFPPLTATIFGLRWPRPLLRERIALRLRQRLEEGMVEEVAQLHVAGVSWTQLESYGLEYRFIARHLQGELNFNDMQQKLQSAIGQFAKRQETWFRRMERRGSRIIWLDGDRDPLDQLRQHLLSLDFPVPGPHQ